MEEKVKGAYINATSEDGKKTEIKVRGDGKTLYAMICGAIDNVAEYISNVDGCTLAVGMAETHAAKKKQSKVEAAVFACFHENGEATVQMHGDCADIVTLAAEVIMRIADETGIKAEDMLMTVASAIRALEKEDGHHDGENEKTACNGNESN